MNEIRVPGEGAPRAAIPFGVDFGLHVNDISVYTARHLGELINRSRARQDAQLRIRLVEMEEGKQCNAAAAVGPQNSQSAPRARNHVERGRTGINTRRGEGQYERALCNAPVAKAVSFS